MARQWHTHSFRAMNTAVDIWSFCGDDGTRMLDQAERFFRQVERRMSRFDRSSELSRLNRAAGGAVQISDELYDVVELALAAAEATGGLFDPTILTALEGAGYDRSIDALRTEGDRLHPHGSGEGTIGGGTYRDIRIWNQGPRPTICLPKGVRLDLGGVAKGWTVDRVVDRLAPHGPCLVNAGGDLYAHGAPPGDVAWTVGVEDPLDGGRDVAVLALRDRAVATSCRTKRHWVQHGQPQHHLIDARLGRPAESDLLSVTVVAPRVALAEIHTKAVFILGAEAGFAYLERQPQIAGLLVRQDGRLLISSRMSRYINDEETIK